MAWLWLVPVTVLGAYLLARWVFATAYTSEREAAIQICSDIAKYDAMTPQEILAAELANVREEIAGETRWHDLLFEEAGSRSFLVVGDMAGLDGAPPIHQDLFAARTESVRRLEHLKREEAALMARQGAADSIKSELLRALNEQLATVRLWEERLRNAALLFRSRRARSLTIV